jgi:phage terminase Nu1 subunit (DNA packaging protein)
LLAREEERPQLCEADTNMTIECGREQLCEDFGLEPNRVNVLAREGTVVKLKRGQYDYRGSVKGYITYLRKLAQGRGTGDYQASRAKREAQKSELAEIELLERKGKLILAEEVQRGFEEYNAMIVSALRAAPAHASDAEVQQIMEETVDRLCRDLARLGGAAIVDRARSRTLHPSRTADNKRVGGKGKSSEPKDKRRAGTVAKRQNPVPD